MSFSSAPLTQPEPEDFRRIGLRRAEFRPLVIRLAMMRSAQLLKASWNDGAHSERAQGISQVLISGYRVMDPRRRRDVQQRAMLGRLHVQVFEESVCWGLSPVAPDEGLHDFQNRLLAASSCRLSGRRLVAAQALSVENLVEEGVANLCGRFSLAPEKKTSILPVGDLAWWRATLSAEDLMHRPLRLRALGALRRSFASLSPAARVAVPVLAASVLLLFSWQMVGASLGSANPSGVGGVVGATSAAEPFSAGSSTRGDQSAWANNPIPAVSEDRVASLTRELTETHDGRAVGTELKMLGSEPLVPPSQDPFALDPLGLDPLGMDPLAESVALGPVVVEVLGEEFLEIRPLISSRSRKGGRIVPPAAAVAPMSPSGGDFSRLSAATIDPDAVLETAAVIQAVGGLETDLLPAERVADSSFGKPSNEQLAACRSAVERMASGRIGRLGEAWEVYRQIAREAAGGSVDGWVAWLNAGQAAIMERRFEDAQRVVAEMAVWAGLDPFDATYETAAWTTAEVSMGEPLKAASEWLDRRIRFGLLYGNLASADKIQGLMQEMGTRNRDPETVLLSREWREVLDRCRRLQASVDALGPNPNQVELDATERLAQGRYWALVRRDWERALPHLAAGPAGRLSRLAMTESQIVEAPDRDTAIRLSEGYLSEASKYKGWLAESLAVHAHELLTSAANFSESATDTLELRRRAIAIEAIYPQGFVPLEDAGTAGGEGAATSVDRSEEEVGRFRYALL